MNGIEKHITLTEILNEIYAKFVHNILKFIIIITTSKEVR